MCVPYKVSWMVYSQSLHTAAPGQNRHCSVTHDRVQTTRKLLQRQHWDAVHSASGSSNPHRANKLKADKNWILEPIIMCAEGQVLNSSSKFCKHGSFYFHFHTHSSSQDWTLLIICFGTNGTFHLLQKGNVTAAFVAASWVGEAGRLCWCSLSSSGACENAILAQTTGLPSKTLRGARSTVVLTQVQEQWGHAGQRFVSPQNEEEWAKCWLLLGGTHFTRKYQSENWSLQSSV